MGSHWHDFDATNEKDTCLWCGKKLVWEYTADYEKAETSRGGHLFVETNRRRRYDAPGPYGDGFFCTLRCAYQFGAALARGGRRLRPKNGQQSEA